MSNAIELRKPAALAATRSEPMSEWARMREMARELVDSGFLPKAINTPEKALAIIQTGKELGLAPMQALRSIHIIEGKPTLSADLIAGLVLARTPGATLRVDSSTDDSCVVLAARPGTQPTRFEFSMKDAQRAGLTSKQNWRNYPRQMLRARCLTEAARAVFPDSVMGIFDADELGAVTTTTGEIVQMPGDTGIRISPHGVDEDETPPPDAEAFEALLSRLTVVESAIPLCKDYAGVLALRDLLGSRAKQSQLTKDIQAAKERGDLSPSQSAVLGKTWMRCDRQVVKLEATIAPPDAAESFTDEPDPAEAFDR